MGLGAEQWGWDEVIRRRPLGTGGVGAGMELAEAVLGFAKSSSGGWPSTSTKIPHPPL